MATKRNNSTSMRLNQDALNKSFNRRALEKLAAAGCRFFRCKPDRTPGVKGWQSATAKHPDSIRLKGAADTLADGATVQTNVYGVCMPDGMVVLDFDGPAGVKHFAEWYAWLRHTLIVRTPSGGYHVYFRYSGVLGQDQAGGNGLDTRIGGKGYVVGPGSTGARKMKAGKVVYENGAYQAENHLGISELPEAMAEKVRAVMAAQKGKPKKHSANLPNALTETEAAKRQAAGSAPKAAGRGKEWDKWLAADIGLVETTHQLHGPCPLCGGEDRFRVQPDDRIYCRQCGAQGDAKFVSDVRHKVFKEPKRTPSHNPDVPVDVYEAGGNVVPLRAAKAGRKREKAPILGKAEMKALSPVQWAWKGWIPTGTLTLVAGGGAAGKGTMMAWIARCLIKGEWPDGAKSEPGKVLLHSREDCWNDTVLPRLAATGLSNEEIEWGAVPLAADAMMRRGEMIDAIKADPSIRAVIFDDYADGMPPNRCDDNKRTDVQEWLNGLQQIAECGIAVIGNRHLKKFSRDYGGFTQQLVLGAQAWTTRPRMVMMLIRHEDPDTGADTRTLLRIKTNLPVDTYGGFKLEGSPDVFVADHPDGEIRAGVAYGWHPVDGSAEQLAMEALGIDKQTQREQDGRRTKRDSVRGALMALLKGDGLSGTNALAQAAEATEATKPTVAAAFAEMCKDGIAEKVGKSGITDEMRSAPGIGSRAQSVWRLK